MLNHRWATLDSDEKGEIMSLGFSGEQKGSLMPVFTTNSAAIVTLSSVGLNVHESRATAFCWIAGRR